MSIFWGGLRRVFIATCIMQGRAHMAFFPRIWPPFEVMAWLIYIYIYFPVHMMGQQACISCGLAGLKLSRPLHALGSHPCETAVFGPSADDQQALTGYQPRASRVPMKCNTLDLDFCSGLRRYVSSMP